MRIFVLVRNYYFGANNLNYRLTAENVCQFRRESVGKSVGFFCLYCTVNKRGVISMARTSDPDSATSQFFIVHKDSTFLDGDYAAFGHVTAGMDIVDRICTESKPVDNNGTIPTEEQPVINSIVIRSK